MKVIPFLAAIVAMTMAASAHAMLEHAVPAAGASITQSPNAVALLFSENLEPALSSVDVTDVQGKSVTAGAVIASGNAMSVALKPLAPGKYRVTWHAVSVDTHRTQGAYRFTVAK